MAGSQAEPKTKSGRIQNGIAAVITRYPDDKPRFSENEEVLLTKRSRNPRRGYWHMAGGAIELYEPRFDALVREIREELHVDIDIVWESHRHEPPPQGDILTSSNPLIQDALLRTPPAAITESIVEPEGRHVLMLHYYARILNEGTPRCGDGTAALGWFNQEQVSQLLVLPTCKTALNIALNWNLK